MSDFNIEIPKEVLTPGKHNSIDYRLFEGKIILALMGYARSGKDSIAKIFVNDYGYQRVAFADNIKKEMNLHLRQLVCDDLNIRGREEVQKLRASGKCVKETIWTISQIDFFTEDLRLKKILRPYIIWYGEKLRTINGKFCWINKAFAEDGRDMDKIVLSDIRRLSELDVFRNSNEFKKRQKNSLIESGTQITQITTEVNNYGTLLFEVNQMGLIDNDVLTIETIQTAHEQWLVDDIFMINPLIPEDANYRKKAMETQVQKIAKKFGINKPEKTKHPQSNIFQTISIPFVD